jgi:hypothetical protein
VEVGDLNVHLAISDHGEVLQDARLSSLTLNQAGSSTDARARLYHICHAYSTPEGCPAGDACHYEHVCDKAGCYGAHPGCEHHKHVQDRLLGPGGFRATSRRGDWRCPHGCGNNFERRSECYRCRAPRPPPAGGKTWCDPKPETLGRRGGGRERSGAREGTTTTSEERELVDIASRDVALK